MAPLFWLVVAPIAAAVAWFVRRRPTSRRAALDRFARRVELPVPDGLRPRVEALLAARDLSTDLGAIAGVALAAVWALLTRSPLAEGSLWPLVLLGAAFTGAAVGAGLTAGRRAARRFDATEPRLARPTAASLSDYLAPSELQGGRIAALLPALLLLAATALGTLTDAVALERTLSPGPLAAALLSLAALAGSEVAGRRLLAQPQTATSGIELAWSDAIRARVLRDLITVPICAGTYLTFGVLLTLGEALRDETLRSTLDGVVGILAIVALGLAFASLLARPQQHFRRRLWPTLDADASDVGSAR